MIGLRAKREIKMNESKKILVAGDDAYDAEYAALADATDAAAAADDAAYEAERAYYAAKNAAFQSAIEGGQEFFLADKWGRYAGEAELQPYYTFVVFPTSDGFELCPLPIFGAMMHVDSADLGLYESEGAVRAESIESALARGFGAQYAGPAYWLEYSVGWTVLSPEAAALAAADDNTLPTMEADDNTLPTPWKWSEDKWGKEELEATPYGVALRKLRNAPQPLDEDDAADAAYDAAVDDAAEVDAAAAAARLAAADADSLNKQNVVLVGRHMSVLPPEVRVISQENITWALTRQECQEQLGVLIAQAREIKCGILFQNIPGTLMCAIVSQGTSTVPMGVIISVPGPRSANIAKSWMLPAAVYADGSGKGADEVREMIQEVVTHTNGRAKFAPSAPGEVDGFTVTVDPVTEFQFSHIEWLWE